MKEVEEPKNKNKEMEDNSEEITVMLRKRIHEEIEDGMSKYVKIFDERIDELEKRITELKEVMEVENEELKKVLKEKNEELKKVMKEMNDKLEEECSELEELEDTNLALLIKERQSNDELQEALKELTKGLRDLSGGESTVGVKRIGEVDDKPFVKVCEQRFSGEIVELQHAMLISKWQENLRDPAWYPFKRVGTGEKMKEVVDEEDEKLQNLRQECGEDVKNAVKTALEELNEFNPSGRYAVHVLWNFEHGRTATIKEGIAQMTQEIRNLKCKRT